MEEKQHGKTWDAALDKYEVRAGNYMRAYEDFDDYFAETYGSKGSDGKCPNCGAMEVDAMSPRTIYECGSSDYDQRPNTFKQSEGCKDSDDHIVDTNEMMYSQEEVYHILVEHTAFLFQGGKSTLTEWFEKYKK